MSSNSKMLTNIVRDVVVARDMVEIVMHAVADRRWEATGEGVGAILYAALDRLGYQIEQMHELIGCLEEDERLEEPDMTAKAARAILERSVREDALELDISYQAGTDMRGGGRDAAGKSGAEGVQNRAGAPGVHE